MTPTRVDRIETRGLVVTARKEHRRRGSSLSSIPETVRTSLRLELSGRSRASSATFLLVNESEHPTPVEVSGVVETDRLYG